jgi:galactokinase
LSDRSFEDLFGRSASIHASAPGRVNLIGEHTDYNDGFVLPIAIPQQTTIDLAPRTDDLVHVWSANVPAGERSARYVLGAEARQGSWVDYIAGVTQVLHADRHAVGGFEARIVSTVPLGGGLSSSASLEVALLRALNAAFGLGLGAIDIARVAHRAETGLVGAPVGIMDQMAASLAGADAALFLDTRTLAFERVPLPPSTSLIVIHSGVTHRHAGGEYRIRRAECDEAARRLGIEKLRDVTVDGLRGTALPPPLDRRARHVVTENARVLDACRAMRAGDARGLGALMSASHVSMRDDFEVSVPQIDLLVEIASAEPGVIGARLTGGGFGGSIVVLAERAASTRAAQQIGVAYGSRVSERPTVLVS